MSLVLVADIGGTNSRFAIYAKLGAKPEFQTTLKTASYKTFAELLIELKKSQTLIAFSEIKSAVFAVAAPIIDTENVIPPNISWKISRSEIVKILDIDRAKLINDFQAQALAVLLAENIQEIVKGEANQSYPRAVIGAGTGFGKSLLVNAEDNLFISLASEGGHNDFPTLDGQEVEFREFAIKKYKLSNLVWDDVLSGRGLETLHEFLTGEKLTAPEISTKYLSQISSTLEIFSKFYARAARSYVLETMALGGLYIAGGVAVKNPLVVHSESFRTSFLASKYSEILAKIPIYLVDSDNTGLIGASYEAFKFSK